MTDEDEEKEEGTPVLPEAQITGMYKSMCASQLSGYFGSIVSIIFIELLYKSNITHNCAVIINIGTVMIIYGQITAMLVFSITVLLLVHYCLINTMV